MHHNDQMLISVDIQIQSEIYWRHSDIRILGETPDFCSKLRKDYCAEGGQLSTSSTRPLSRPRGCQTDSSLSVAVQTDRGPSTVDAHWPKLKTVYTYVIQRESTKLWRWLVAKLRVKYSVRSSRSSGKV